MMEFQTENYSGPLGLLLLLIEKEKLDIIEINLAKIADQYVERVNSSSDINPEELADFLLIASKLLFIKSKALLPYLYFEEEDEDLDDLEKQLRMYKEFVLASQRIKKIIEQKRFLYLPVLGKGRRYQFKVSSFSEPKNVNRGVIKEVFLNLVEELKKKEAKKLPEEKLEPKINIEERIRMIKDLLKKRIKLSFSKFISQAQTKTEIVVSFLAVLELAKQHEIAFEQEELFSEIHIKYKK